MTITAQIIADSVSDAGIRLTTLQLRYPRFVHAEFMTHRVLSRNASSSRAIPVAKMIEDLRRDPAMPVYWGSNKPGMQAGEQLAEPELSHVQDGWLVAMERAIAVAEEMIKHGLHKQIANRILEPWAHINVVVTATDWNNFFHLRRHPDAQPEMRALADAVWDAMQVSLPETLGPGHWHLPYADGTTGEAPSMDLSTPEAVELARKVSVARCARVSYLTHDGRQTSVEEDVQLFERLVGGNPLHASPTEHQATPLRLQGTFHHSITGEPVPVFQSEHLQGNLRGWAQYRKTLQGEFVAG